MKFRTGFGFDVHQLVEGRDLWLGGIKLPAEKGGRNDRPVKNGMDVDEIKPFDFLLESFDKRK